MFCPRCATEYNERDTFCVSCGLEVTGISKTVKEVVSQPADDIEVVRDALKGEYEVTRLLGRGGMAMVFLGRDLSLEREVAIKVLPLNLAYEDEFVQRFEREAKTAAQLEHPAIIPIHRVGKSGRIIYFVMKFLKGQSLGAILHEKKTLPPEQIQSILIECAAALGYAHKHGVVHRDIKPDNIVFDESGRPIVTDFGIAKAATGTKLTGTGMAIGTPYYMSPEQARAQDLDGRSDIYSLGVVAYECLCGQVPFGGTDSFAVGIKHISEQLPIPDLTTDAQRDFFEIIKKMLEKDPMFRFQNTDELVSALRGGATTGATVAMAASDPAMASAGQLSDPVTPRTPLPSPGAKSDKAGRKVGMALAAAAILVLVGGGGAFMVSKMASTDSETTPTSVADRDGGAEIADTSNAEPDSIQPAMEAGDPSPADEETAGEVEETSPVEVAVRTTTPPVTTQSTARRQATEAVGAATATGTDVARRTGTDNRGNRSRNAGTPTAAERTAQSRTQARQRWQQLARQQMSQLDERLGRGGFERSGEPALLTLTSGQNETREILLETGSEYEIIGMCDPACNGLNFSVTDGGILQRAQRGENSRVASLRIRPDATRNYSFAVTIEGCSQAQCGIGFISYSRPYLVKNR